MKISYCFIIIGVFAANYVHAMSDEHMIRNLITEKNQKLATLEKCAKKVNGFKIAGVSTIGLTAVGVAGNIALADKNKEMDNQIVFAQKELARQQDRLNKTQTKVADLQKTIEERKAECDKHSDIAKWNGEKCVCRDEKKILDIDEGTCLSITDRIKEIDTRCDEIIASLVDYYQNEADNTYAQIARTPRSICTICDPECLILEKTGYLGAYNEYCRQVGGQWDLAGSGLTLKTSVIYDTFSKEVGQKFASEYNLNASEMSQIRQALTQCIQSKIQFFKVSCICN